MPEAYLESRLRDAIKLRGGLSIKLACPWFTGLPDRLNLLPGGRVYFVETKFGKGVLSQRQKAVQKQLEKLGFPVWNIWNNEHLNLFLETIDGRI